MYEQGTVDDGDDDECEVSRNDTCYYYTVRVSDSFRSILLVQQTAYEWTEKFSPQCCLRAERDSHSLQTSRAGLAGWQGEVQPECFSPPIPLHRLVDPPGGILVKSVQQIHLIRGKSSGGRRIRDWR